jgi:RHH-type transcriptional regulator, proline utilization regulon repressor / proline dehydrogenase / delta 1-pyrroline-5-carboxylate dehydrogenase
VSDLGPFANEPLLELRRADVRAQLEVGFEKSERAQPLRIPVRIADGERFGEEIVSLDPGAPDRVVALAASATRGEVGEAVATGLAAASEWASRPARERAAALLGAAAWLRSRRQAVAALEVRECAKPWLEADADVCEAIDYLEYYARAALELERGGTLVQVPGERNELLYVGRGVAAIIAPWNFPVAIPMGMTAAAIVSGNAAILKPAEQSPACGAIVVDALRAGGVPDAVVGLLPGGGEVGAALVSHRDVAVIAFTGSLAVGLEVVRAAAEVTAGQLQLKRVVAEFGGKNCIIVERDADLDEAVPAIIASAFSYAGQKCSAAARVLVADRIADRFLERLAGAASVLVVGQAREFSTEVPPVIEESALERVRRYAALCKKDGEILAEIRAPQSPGYFAAPLVVTGLPADSPVLHEEIFGPILAVERFNVLEEAIARIEALPFALTAGLFSRDPRVIASVAGALSVGNLYVNRAITGAMVGRQPFGGNRLSGNGTKAGGPDYLKFFTDAKVVSENTERHGLVV